MKLRKFSIILAITACLIASIIGLVNRYSLLKLSYTLVIVLLVFFVLGTIFQNMLNKSIQKQEEINAIIGKQEADKVNEDAVKDED